MTDHALIEDSAGDKLFVKLDPGCEACLRQCDKASEVVSDCARVGRRRRGRFDALLGTVYLCTDAEDDVRSSKHFRSRIEVMGGAIQLLLDTRDSAREAARRDAKRITHNLRTLCSRVSLELYSIASQEQLVAETDSASQMRVLRDSLLEEPDETAAVLLRVLKNCQAMAHEFSVFERLDSSRHTDVRPMPHVLHRVVRNVVAFFFQDFQSSGITVRQSPSDTKVKLDYETFSVAMYYILDNATKYCAHGSRLNIRFEEKDGLRLLLEMTSLQVGLDEAESIFDEHYSGRTARLLQMNGTGIGMYLANRLLSLGKIGIRFIPGPLIESSVKNAGYAYNTIEILFPRDLIVEDSARKHPSRPFGGKEHTL